MYNIFQPLISILTDNDNQKNSEDSQIILASLELRQILKKSGSSSVAVVSDADIQKVQDFCKTLNVVLSSYTAPQLCPAGNISLSAEAAERSIACDTWVLLCEKGKTPQSYCLQISKKAKRFEKNIIAVALI